MLFFVNIAPTILFFKVLQFAKGSISLLLRLVMFTKINVVLNFNTYPTDYRNYLIAISVWKTGSWAFYFNCVCMDKVLWHRLCFNIRVWRWAGDAWILVGGGNRSEEEDVFRPTLFCSQTRLIGREVLLALRRGGKKRFFHIRSWPGGGSSIFFSPYSP